MTPLLGTKTPSAPVGAKSGGDTRAARSLLSCAIVARHGAAMARHGRPPRPRPHRHPKHGLSVPVGTEALQSFFRSGAGSRIVGDKSGGDTMGRLWRGMGGRRPPHRHTACKSFTDHETRDTKLSAFPTNSRDFPLFPAIPPPPPDVRVPVSISVGLAASAVRCRCCRPLGCFHRRERNRNPCSESRTFWIALTSRSAGPSESSRVDQAP